MDPNRDIYKYSNYRDFLKDYYLHGKRSVPGFSYTTIAQRGRFSSSSFPKLVIDGKRNLTRKSLPQMAKALKLNKQAFRYFENIVYFSQEKKITDKTRILKKIDSIRKKNQPGKLLPEQYDYLKEWYHSTIRELVDISGFNESPEWIANVLEKKVKVIDIENSINFLLKNNFIKRNKNGELVKKDMTLATGEVPDQEILATTTRQFHLKMVDLAREAISEKTKEERNVTNSTLCFSKEGYAEVVKRIQNLHYELLEFAKKDKKSNRVYGLNVNLFPLTKRLEDLK